jgi:hypothetical protein
VKIHIIGKIYHDFFLQINPKDPTKEFLRKFAIGFVAGTLGSCTNIPFDVAKSRIQVSTSEIVCKLGKIHLFPVSI